MTTNTCHFCSKEQFIVTSAGNKLSRLISENHWVGNGWIRIEHCSGCQVTRRPRKPRAPKPNVVPATDWNMLVAFSRKGA